TPTPPVLEDPLDLCAELIITDRPRRRRAGLGRVVRARSDLVSVRGEHATDRPDPERVVVLVDERDHHGSRGSSSRAKKLEAANKISLARFNSFTSCSSSRIRLLSQVVVPGSSPASTAACLHQPR